MPGFQPQIAGLPRGMMGLHHVIAFLHQGIEPPNLLSLGRFIVLGRHVHSPLCAVWADCTMSRNRKPVIGNEMLRNLPYF